MSVGFICVTYEIRGEKKKSIYDGTIPVCKLIKRLKSMGATNISVETLK